MKFIMLCFTIVCILFYSCGDSPNDLMGRLLNRKKQLTDSIDYFNNSESYYRGKAKEAMRSGADTIHWQSFADSSTMASSAARAMGKELKETEFSIDSLSKMK